jgi:hypothetical protein
MLAFFEVAILILTVAAVYLTLSPRGWSLLTRIMRGWRRPPD